MPDDYQGEAPAAFVEPRPGAALTEEALRAFLKDKLSPVEMPRLIELREEGCLSALTDVGGAGLNSAVGEIGEACGVWINTALVPLKTAALPMWRILLSESQERMLLAVPPEHQERAKKILDRHMVRSTVIGRFADTGRYHVFHAPDLTEDALRPQGMAVDREGFDAAMAQQKAAARPHIQHIASSEHP